VRVKESAASLISAVSNGQREQRTTYSDVTEGVVDVCFGRLASRSDNGVVGLLFAMTVQDGCSGGVKRSQENG
jgi:hypothetical protein